MGWRTVLFDFLLLPGETVAMQKDGDKERGKAKLNLGVANDVWM